MNNMQQLKLVIERYGVMLIGIIILLFVVIGTYLNTRSSNDIVQMTSVESKVTSVFHDETTEESWVYVDVKGEVKQPGVYRLREGERVVDAIKMAGGFLEEAAEIQLNLAQLLHDQMLIYVPNINDSTLLEEIPVGESHSGVGTEGVTNNLININTADVAQLTQLPGIGTKKAEAIVAHRQQNGFYPTIEALMEVTGIGQSTFETLKEWITVEP